MRVREFSRSLATCAVATCLGFFELTQFAVTAESKSINAQARSPSPISGEYFGLHIHHLDVPYKEGNSSWPFLAFGSWRLQGAYVNWLDLEPQKGQWNFRRLDKYVEDASKHNVDLLLTLGKTPTWASARPGEPCDGCAAEPAEIEDWKNYIRTVVRRYKGRIKSYEVWNEPRFYELEGKSANGEVGYYSGTAKKLVELTAVAKQVISEEDPAAKLVSPSFVSGNLGIRRLEFYLDAGGAGKFDILGFHFYADVPEKIPDMARKLLAVKNKYGLSAVPIWNTESGFTYERQDLSIAANTRTGSYLDVLPIRLGAAYLARSMILGGSNSVERFYWFNWDGEPPHPTMGIASGRGRYATPMTLAYRKVRQWLLGSVVESCDTGRQKIWRCKIRTANDEAAWIVWSEHASVATDLPRALMTSRADPLLGDQILTIPDATQFVIGPEPVMLLQ